MSFATLSAVGSVIRNLVQLGLVVTISFICMARLSSGSRSVKFKNVP